MKRNQTFHEHLIPMLVEGVGAETYLEFGTHKNETISKVRCKRRIGVDLVIRFHPGIELHRMSTKDFILDMAPRRGPYDFVFIDADHSAKAVKEDFYGIAPYVSDEGLICLHDTNPATLTETTPGFCGDAWRAARSISVDFEAVTLPYSPGLTIVRKRVKWGPK